MRFLHITHRYLPAIGGAEQYIADVSAGLVQRGHEVDVFTSRALTIDNWENALPPFARLNGVTVHRFWAMRRGEWVWRVLHFGLGHYWRRRWSWYQPLILFGGGPISPSLFWATFTKGRRYDLIHLNCLVHSHATYSYWATRFGDTPVVVTPHAHAEQEVTYNLGHQRAVLAGCDHVIADTPAERDLFLNLGLDPWRVSIGGTGLQPDLYPPGGRVPARRQLGLPEEGFVMLFLGRKSNYKGVDKALAAFQVLKPYFPHMRFLAVGPETDYSQTLWQRHREVPDLYIFDAVPHAQKVTALQACDCLVLPSAGEAFGMVLLEAWSVGRPVIGARTLAMAAVIQEGEDGLLADPGDVTDLATCIARLAADPELACRLGGKGQEKVGRRYTVSHLADRVEGIYHRVLRQRQRQKERNR